MTKNEYPHFNPTKHGIDVKISTVRTGSHSKHNINYHIIWIPTFKHLWAKGYYIGSAGHVSQDAVKRYILEQQGKDVFEYHIFGNHEQKIGDFTQTNLRKWSK